MLISLAAVPTEVVGAVIAGFVAGAAAASTGYVILDATHRRNRRQLVTFSAGALVEHLRRLLEDGDLPYSAQRQVELARELAAALARSVAD